MAKEQRPVPLPNRQGTATTPASGSATPPPAKRPLPAGAAKWSKVYLDRNGVPVESVEPVPVDEHDRRTGHLKHTCRGHITVGGVKQPCDHVAWLTPEDGKRFCPDHGCELDAEQTPREPLLPWDAMWQAVRLPIRAGYALAGEVAAGLVVEQAHAGPGVALLAGSVATAGAATWTWKHQTGRARKNGDIEKGQKTGRHVRRIRRRVRLAGYMGATFGTWLTAAATVDPTSLAGKAVWCSLPVVWALSWAPWWRYQEQFRNRPVVPPAAATGVPVAGTPDFDREAALADATTWAEDVAAACPGLGKTAVDVDTWQADEGGRRMVVRASKGGITDETMRQALPSIAGAFGVKKAAIGWICEFDGSPRSVLLLVQPRSPLNELVPGKPIDVFDVNNARAHMGTKIDGTDLETRLWTPGWGAPSRLILGTKGSGKTGTVRRLIYVQLKARVTNPRTGKPVRLVAPFLHDPKRGADYGLFRRLVCGFSISSDTLHMIVDAFSREMDRRYDMLGSTVWEDDDGRLWEGERPFDPTTMGPILALNMDEFHVDAKDQALMAKLEPFGRKMRAAAIEINVATHAATIGDTGSQSFRDMLAGGEAWLLRTTMGLNAALATGGQLTGDPRGLPRVPGMLLHAAGEDATMQCRAAFDDPKVMYDQLYGPGRVPLIQPVEFPPETLEAFGKDFVAWMRECQESSLGSPVPGVPKTLQVGAAASGRDVNAEDALRQILFLTGAPMKREDIAAHPLWAPRSVTSTLTKTLRAGQDANPPWLIRLPQGNGVYDLTLPMRQQMQAAAEEEKEPAAA